MMTLRWFLALAVLCTSAKAWAQAALLGGGDSEKKVYRGTQVWTNGSTQATFLQRGESGKTGGAPNRTQSVGTSLQLRPQWWFGDNYYARGVVGGLVQVGELAVDDDRSRLNDSFIIFGASNLFSLPGSIGVAGEATFQLPTSQLSRQANLITSASARLDFMRMFKGVANGLLFGFSTGVTGNLLSDYYNGGSQAEIQPGLATEGFVINTGARGAFASTSVGPWALMFLPKGFSLIASLGMSNALLPGFEDVEAISSGTPGGDARIQTSFSSSLGVWYRISPTWLLTGGFASVTPYERNTDRNYTPLVTRDFTQVSVSIRMNIANFVSGFAE